MESGLVHSLAGSVDDFLALQVADLDAEASKRVDFLFNGTYSRHYLLLLRFYSRLIEL